ncbi:hypothetical protein [Novosphingobium decolorationis]|uniref:Uncharacterized protein n=1 Tax=Novosphingobium decolorationis TaxID=2698673 RepID=A0ABX8E6J9_9SPHN|nr:hypothetical protein [Novosphingobium decolorationis]MED5545012.1 hypothetical protein [Pseudomonadota bacterium]QVM83676.1 hypothetical protein HT578_08185 [Novosphingobium decolorationis]
MPFELNLTAFRHAPWGGTTGLADLVRMNDDWSLAQFSWAFSSAPGGANAFTLETADEGAEGVSSTFDPDYPHPSTAETVGGTTIRPQIDQATLEAVADARPEKEDIELHHTLYVTPSGEPRRVLCFGRFTIKKGAPTQ